MSRKCLSLETSRSEINFIMRFTQSLIYFSRHIPGISSAANRRLSACVSVGFFDVLHWNVGVAPRVGSGREVVTGNAGRAARYPIYVLLILLRGRIRVFTNGFL